MDRGMPKEAAARIRSSGTSLLGVVTNAVKQESNRSGTYGYGYGRYGYGGYGYGYGPGRYATNGSSLDPRAAYTYYGDTTGDTETEPAATTTRQAILQRVKRQQQRLMRWLDT